MVAYNVNALPMLGNSLIVCPEPMLIENIKYKITTKPYSIPSAATKADSEPQPMIPMSSPNFGNAMLAAVRLWSQKKRMKTMKFS